MENKACCCEGKNVSQLGCISSQAGQDLCKKVWITDAKSAGHNQHMLSPLFKIFLDYMPNRDQGTSERHTQRLHYPAASTERDISCLTSQLREENITPFQGRYSEGAKQSHCCTDLNSVDVKIATHNLTAKTPVNAVCSFQHAWHALERAGGMLQSACNGIDPLANAGQLPRLTPNR